MVEADSVISELAIGARRRAASARRSAPGQGHQRNADVGGTRAPVAHSVGTRIFRQRHQPIRPFPGHELGLDVVLPAGVRLHGHVTILSCYNFMNPRKLL